MERLTKWLNDKTAICIKECEKECVEGYTECHKCEPFKDVMKRLAEYEDAEEQGLLLRLTCKVGSTLYQPINSHVNEYKVIGLCFDIFQNKWMYEVAYEVVGVWNKTICDFEVIGKTVFLTKEEAAQALKQMGE